jgi:predicted DNA binding protein
MAIVSSDEAALRIIVRQQRSEIERLKDAIRRIADQDATLSVRGGNVTVTMDATLTDAEREAVKLAAEWFASVPLGDTLRGLLERTK